MVHVSFEGSLAKVPREKEPNDATVIGVLE